MEHLQTQKDKAEQRLAKLEAEQKQQLAKLKAREKRLEHERRILAGAVFLELVKQGKFPRSEFLKLMNQHTKSKKHRALFDLPAQETFPDWLEAESAQAEAT